VQPLGPNALVGTRRGVDLIRARGGRLLRHHRRLTLSLLGGDAPLHY
jgi:hypothetical protein